MEHHPFVTGKSTINVPCSIVELPEGNLSESTSEHDCPKRSKAWPDSYLEVVPELCQLETPNVST